jgi:hypothetical protein
VLVQVGLVDPVANRLLGRALQLRVDRQLDRLALERQALRHQLAARTAQRVDTQLREARMPAQVGVVACLDAGLADLVARGVALPLQLLELRGRDLVHVAEHLRSKVAVWVVADVGIRDADARELVGVFVEVVDRRGALDVLAHHHRRYRVVAARLDPAQHLVDRDVHDPREAP